MILIDKWGICVAKVSRDGERFLLQTANGKQHFDDEKEAEKEARRQCPDAHTKD